MRLAMNMSSTYHQSLLRVRVPMQPAAMPASIEFKASSLFLIHLSAHLTVLSANVEALRKMMIEKYSGVNDFLILPKPLVSERNDLINCSMELMMRPYLTCLMTCLRVSGMQPLGCLQNLVFAFIDSQLQLQSQLYFQVSDTRIYGITQINNNQLVLVYNKYFSAIDRYKRVMIRTSSSKSEVDSIDDRIWVCEACTFKNHAGIKQCEICSTPKDKKPAKEQKIDVEKTSDLQCHACKKQIKALVSNCPHCNQVLIPEEDEEEGIEERGPAISSKSSKMTKCQSCHQQNDLANDECVFCQASLRGQIQSGPIPIKKRAPKKPRTYRRAPYYGGFGGVGIGGTGVCKYCKLPQYGITLESHQISCAKMSEQQLQIRFLQVQKKYCPFCYQKFDSSKYDSHEKQCNTRKQFYSQDSDTFKRCTKLQRDTMIYMHKKSEKLHWISEKPLIQRIVKLGKKPSDLQNLHHYIVNYAPIIIHMHVTRHMEFFVKDTHYRNQFETKKSSGSLSETSRTSWEDRMFDHLHHNAKPFERVKYGTINFTNDPKGVRACVSYGQSYFLLKPHVRNRCTVTDMDSSSSTATIATFQFCYHLLNKLPDAELQAAFEGSKANEVASNVIGTYKEIQIHGPVEFKHDIERVYVNKAELVDPKFQKMVKQFCKNNELEYETFAMDTHPAGGGAFGFGSVAFAPAPLPTFFSAPASTFSAPAPTFSTTHLFGAPRPVPKSIKKPQKQLKQGVDYI